MTVCRGQNGVPRRVTPVMALAVMMIAAVIGPQRLQAEGHAAADRQTRVVPLPEGRSLSVALTVGNLEIVGEARDHAVIDIVRTAPDEGSLSRLPIVIDETATSVRVSATQPNDDTDPSLRTDITLRVPRTAAVDMVRMLEGRLSVRGVHGTLNAEVQRGTIEARDVSGTLRLSTTVGDVIVHDARLVPDGVLRLRTFNGDVRLALAQRPADARILALVLNGDIRSEIPLQTKDQWGPRWGEASLGKGEPVISIDVVTGSIEITSPPH